MMVMGRISLWLVMRLGTFLPLYGRDSVHCFGIRDLFSRMGSPLSPYYVLFLGLPAPVPGGFISSICLVMMALPAEDLISIAKSCFRVTTLK